MSKRYSMISLNAARYPTNEKAKCRHTHNIPKLAIPWLCRSLLSRSDPQHYQYSHDLWKITFSLQIATDSIAQWPIMEPIDVPSQELANNFGQRCSEDIFVVRRSTTKCTKSTCLSLSPSSPTVYPLSFNCWFTCVISVSSGPCPPDSARPSETGGSATLRTSEAPDFWATLLFCHCHVQWWRYLKNTHGDVAVGWLLLQNERILTDFDCAPGFKVFKGPKWCLNFFFSAPCLKLRRLTRVIFARKGPQIRSMNRALAVGRSWEGSSPGWTKSPFKGSQIQASFDPFIMTCYATPFASRSKTQSEMLMIGTCDSAANDKNHHMNHECTILYPFVLECCPYFVMFCLCSTVLKCFSMLGALWRKLQSCCLFACCLQHHWIRHNENVRKHAPRSHVCWDQGRARRS